MGNRPIACAGGSDTIALVRVVIIECGVCQQPWAVPIDAVNGHGQRFQLPDPPMLDLATNQPTAVRCAGRRGRR